jgi:hypothetical protein
MIWILAVNPGFKSMIMDLGVQEGLTRALYAASLKLIKSFGSVKLKIHIGIDNQIPWFSIVLNFLTRPCKLKARSYVTEIDASR